MPDPEKVYDSWFRKQPKRAQAELRAKGLGPHCEMPGSPNVFPVIENHAAFGVQPDLVGAQPEPETEEFISATELRHRLQLVFEALEQYASPEMLTNLRFIRALLGGHASGMSLASLAKELGISKQAVAWRSRRILAALGRVSKSSAIAREIEQATKGQPPIEPEPSTAPAGTVAVGPYLIFKQTKAPPRNYTGKSVEKPAKVPRGGVAKASLCTKVRKRVVIDPAVFTKKRVFRGGRYPAMPKKRQGRV
jgi:hypothetical protein